MKRIGILTAGGDTPALNATIHGAVVRANQLQIEIFGLIKGFNCLFNPRVPHVHLNPLFQEIPELDPTKGGTLIGSSRDYVDPDEKDELDLITARLTRLGIEGLIAIGGDGTLNGLQPLAERLPTVLAPKTIDNDLGLNYPSEPDEWVRVEGCRRHSRATATSARRRSAVFDLDQIVNYATPGYATAVFVAAQGVERIRTTAESHRRIAIIEVMGRHSGYIALGTAYGQPDIILVPEHPLDIELLVERVKHLYDLQKNVVIVCGEGIVDEQGVELGAESTSTDPAGNVALERRGGSAAREDDPAARRPLLPALSPRQRRPGKRSSPEKSGTRSAAGGRSCSTASTRRMLGPKAVDLLVEGRNNAVSILQYNSRQGLSRRGLRRQPLPRPLGPDSCAPDAPGALRPAADEAVADRHRLPAADLHRRHRQRRRGAHAPDAVRSRATWRSRITRSTPTSTSASGISSRTGD